MLGKALQRSLFVAKFLKDPIELSDLENFFDLGAQANNLHFAAGFDHLHVALHQFADSGAVQVKQVAGVEDYFLSPLLEKSREGFAQSSAREGSQVPGEIHYGDFACLANGGRKVHCVLFVCPISESGDSTFLERWRTAQFAVRGENFGGKSGKNIEGTPARRYATPGITITGA